MAWAKARERPREAKIGYAECVGFVERQVFGGEGEKAARIEEMAKTTLALFFASARFAVPCMKNWRREMEDAVAACGEAEDGVWIKREEERGGKRRKRRQR